MGEQSLYAALVYLTIDPTLGRPPPMHSARRSSLESSLPLSFVVATGSILRMVRDLASFCYKLETRPDKPFLQTPTRRHRESPSSALRCVESQFRFRSSLRIHEQNRST